MNLSSSYPYHIALLLSFAHISYGAGIPQNTGNHFDYVQPSLVERFEHALTAGLIHLCEQHHVDELNATIYCPDAESTFSSSVSTNSDSLLHRLKRIIGSKPTISISSTTHFKTDETTPSNPYKRAILKFAENKNMPCTQTTDANGKTITCTIVLELKEFLALKEKYKTETPQAQ